MKLKFDCVFYYVRDLDKSIRFYADVLGFPLKSRDNVARFDVDGVLLELVPASGDIQISGDGNARLCLKVEDIGLSAEKLRTSSVRVSKIRTVENGKIASFEDPDGNQLALWQYA